MQNSNLIPSTLSNWREAVDLLTNQWLSANRPFSSGEVAACLRMLRSDLRFSVLSVGEHLRDRFYEGEFNFEENGDCVQVPRRTKGLGRTPAGFEVFVYAPTETSGYEHAFEVDIPRPGETVSEIVAHSDEREDPAPQPPTRQLSASVHSDTRICFGRNLIQALSQVEDHPLTSDSKAYVTFQKGKVLLTLAPLDGSIEHQIARERGRVLASRPGNPLPVFKRFACSIENNAVVVDLTRPL